ncbi:adenine deaminase [Sugiyamaella lignohabitans]|uniref:Adenine deaminase n=1 Tax=Sugiyamaella lignohabitans TaxID=796027 RepID=A0A167C8P8_9ASCO|nr:adenine deaminase [Sugiyamaella lignohabitans]ANB11363.1 adenine deaminase [Sugiyamaella lignohabitans]
MTVSDFDSFLTELPKCEHHVHLEGTLSPELLIDLAKRNNIKLPEEHPPTIEALYDRYSKFSCLQDFLDHYYVGMSVLIYEKDFEDLAYNYFVKAHQDGVHHAEVFFDPQAHLERGIKLTDVVSGITKARTRAESDFGITTKLIMCFLRHIPSSDALTTLHAAVPHITTGHITGIGLDSSELGFPPHLFKEAYATARELNLELNYTAHAGEEGDHTYVLGALDDLKVERIDHGIRSADDDATLKRLAANNTLLTVCPMSNLKLRAVKSIGDIPLRKFLEYGVPFSINSDDPAYFGGYILDNYKEVHKHFNFDLATWIKIAENNIHGSWINQDRKDVLLARVADVRKKYIHLA